MDALMCGSATRPYWSFVELGRAPVIEHVAERLHLLVSDAPASWGRLHDLHALVLEPGGDELRMANPFSAVPTRFRVHAAGRGGSPTAPGTRSGSAPPCTRRRIATVCPDAAIHRDRCHREQPSDDRAVAPRLVPAAQWWDDIVFT